MWYFAWVLGLAMAALFAVVDARWLEFQLDRRTETGKTDQDDGIAR